MTTAQLIRRLAIAFLLAVILAALGHVYDRLHAQDEILVPKQPGLCDSLEPYGYWWFFWGCNLR